MVYVNSLIFKVTRFSAKKDHYGNFQFQLEYEIERILPEQLEITLYETALEQHDKLRIQENESYIPTPILNNDSRSLASFKTGPKSDKLR